jgi:hypothetical protein
MTLTPDHHELPVVRRTQVRPGIQPPPQRWLKDLERCKTAQLVLII